MYEYEEEYDEEEYYYEEESEEDEYQIYYRESELYPAERITRSKARTDPTQGIKVNRNKDNEIIISRLEDIEMSEKEDKENL